MHTFEFIEVLSEIKTDTSQGHLTNLIYQEYILEYIIEWQNDLVYNRWYDKPKVK